MMVMSVDKYLVLSTAAAGLVGSENILAEAGKLSHSSDDPRYFVTKS